MLATGNAPPELPFATPASDRVVTDRTGVVFLEIDGLALPVLQRAMRDGHAPTMARWLAEGTHLLAEWEPDLSSQTGASQAGHLARGSREPRTDSHSVRAWFAQRRRTGVGMDAA